MVGGSIETGTLATEILVAWRTELVLGTRLDINELCLSVEGRIGMTASSVETSACASSLDHVIHLHDRGPSRCQRQDSGKVGDMDHLADITTAENRRKTGRQWKDVKKEQRDRERNKKR